MIDNNRPTKPSLQIANQHLWVALVVPTILIGFPLGILYFFQPALLNRLAETSSSKIMSVIAFAVFAWQTVFWSIILLLTVFRNNNANAILEFGIERQIFGLTGEFRYQIGRPTICLLLVCAFSLASLFTFSYQPVNYSSSSVNSPPTSYHPIASAPTQSSIQQVKVHQEDCPTPLALRPIVKPAKPSPPKCAETATPAPR